MATILLDRHAATERPATSEYTLFSGLERILMTRHNVLRVPPHDSWSEASMETWVSENALSAQLMIGCDSQIIKLLRKHGWNGKIILKALGDLPHGAAGLRGALPYLHKTDAIWCSSVADKQIYDMLVEQDGSQPEAIVLPYGIDCEVFTPLGQADKERLRQAWGLASEDFVVVYAGRITIEKNFHSILEAIHQLLCLRARFKFLVATRIENIPFRQFNMWGTDLDAEIRRLIERLNLSAHVRFVPWLDQACLNELYNVGDVFVNLTLATGENFGYAQVEAMSAGLPVVATAWGGLKDTIIDGQTGFLVDTWVSDYGIRFDMPKVIYALRLLMDEPDLRQELGSCAVQHIRRHYSWSIYSNHLLKIIDILLDSISKKTKIHLTELGSSFHSRFSVVGGYIEAPIARSPVYGSLSDPHYARLIEPYTSQGRIDFGSEIDLFSALTGGVEDGFFYSTDLLWPVRIRINDREAQVMRQLSRYQTVNRATLDCPEDVIRTLVKKGLVGISHRDLPNRSRHRRSAPGLPSGDRKLQGPGWNEA